MTELKNEPQGEPKNNNGAEDNDARLMKRMEDFELGRTDIFGNNLHKNGLISTIADKAKPFFEKLFNTKSAQSNIPASTTRVTKNGIYDGFDTTMEHPNAHGEPFFGLYLRVKGVDSPFSDPDRYEYAAADSEYAGTPLLYLHKIEESDLDAMRARLNNPGWNMFSEKHLKAILNSLSDTTPITRKEFANEFVAAIQTPQAATFMAAAALSVTAPKSAYNGLRSAEPTRSIFTEAEWLSQIATGSTHGNYAIEFSVCAQIFRVDDFAKNPLTEDEIKAIPALAGFYAEAYEEAGQDHSAHALSVTNKLREAGFPGVSAEIAKRHGIEIKKEPLTTRPKFSGDLSL
jgi:hypothetical protein